MQGRSTIYKSIIAPHLEYCPSILFTCNQNQITKMQKQQNKAMRTILRCSKYTSVQSMLDQLNLLSVRQQISYLTMIRIHKLKNRLLPQQICQMVSFVGDAHNYWLRNEHDFRIINTNKATTKNTMMIKGLEYFNNLPSEIKNEINPYKFKNLIIDFIKINIRI